MIPADIDYDMLKKRGFLKQKQEGFFILRTRMPSAGVYTADQLKKLSDISARYAKGIVHATVRQGIEIPYIKYKEIPDVEKELASASIEIGTSGPRLRATTVCPGNNWCKQGLVNTFSLAARIENELGVKCGLDLPQKFKIAISGCPNACTRVQVSEIGIHGLPNRVGTPPAFGYAIYLGGCGGRNPRPADKADKVFTEDEVLRVIEKTVTFYKDHAKPKQRLGALVDEFGKEAFQKTVLA